MSKEIRPRLNGQKKEAYLNITKEENRVLVIGDLHEPFCLDGYFEFCVDTYNKYNCNKVVFIGDIIDNHYSSYHETDADGMGGGQELDLAINKLKKWYKQFPEATITIGNHDRIIMRKAQTSAVPRKWIKDYKEVLETPNWNFVDRIVIDGVQYVHGEGGTAHTKCRADMMPTVQGHLHTQCYIQWFVGANFKVFGMQVGCGIDHDAYAMAYAKRGKKPAIACGVVIGGHTPINNLMNL
jgi:metallophosphoesterase superfamily enzyme